MFHWKHILFIGLVSVVTSPLVYSQEVNQKEDFGDYRKIVQVVRLSHAGAFSVEAALHALELPVSVASTDENQILVRGLKPAVDEVVELIRIHLDVPNSSASSAMAVTEFIRLGLTPTRTLMPALQAVVISRSSKIAIDHANGMLVIHGQPQEVAAVRSLLAQAKRPAKTLMINFFFIRAQIGGSDKPQASFPAALRPIGQTLVDSGFGSLSLMAPVTVMVDDGIEFRSESNLDLTEPQSRSQNLEFQISGTARTQVDDDVVQISIRVEVTGNYGRQGGDGRTYFELDTTLATRLGSYVLLAAAPSSTADGTGIALVVRVTEAESVGTD